MIKGLSVSIIIFAVIEILVGSVGSIFLVKNLISYLITLRSPTVSIGIAGALSLVSIFIYMPSPFIMSSGFAIFIALALGKTFNNTTLSILYFMLIVTIGFHIYTAHYRFIIFDFIAFFIASAPIQWFLSHKDVKVLETKQY